MERPRDRSEAHGQRAYSNDRRPARSEAHQGPRNGPSMTRRRVPEVDEGGVDFFLESFEDMSMDSHKRSTPGGSQGRRGPRRMDDMDGFEEKNFNPRGTSTRGESQGGRDMRRRHMDVVDSFDEEDAGSRRPSTRGESQGGRDMRRRHMDVVDSFDEEDAGPRRPSTRGGPQGRRSTESAHIDNPVTDMVLYAPRGGRGARSVTGMVPHIPGGGRRPKPQTAKPKPTLRELEAELDVVEGEIERAQQGMKASPNNPSFNQAVFKMLEIKMEIYKIDPESGRLDNWARFILHLPPKFPPDHEERGSRYGYRGSAPGRGGNHGHRDR